MYLALSVVPSIGRDDGGEGSDTEKHNPKSYESATYATCFLFQINIQRWIMGHRSMFKNTEVFKRVSHRELDRASKEWASTEKGEGGERRAGRWLAVHGDCCVEEHGLAALMVAMVNTMAYG
ncbi:hypothetical protein L2E82_25141 [Cichorium intybus]|uniref:Uncharacterized protein n=1 Tax=Cichorium intybus TaxID=13427 RepID=A0ACB9E302_CICIN|nr:hypothetical protein L2E82_25141 [Cichorium intybus]